MHENSPHTRRALSLWRIAAWGFVVVGIALVSGWMLPRVIFHYRFGAVLPPGVAGSTNVIYISPLNPPSAPKSYSRQVREYFGCYYGKLQTYGPWWKQVPKALDDVLAEYGARVQDGKLVDASGKAIFVVKKWRGGGGGGTADTREWYDRQSKLANDAGGGAVHFSDG